MTGAELATRAAPGKLDARTLQPVMDSYFRRRAPGTVDNYSRALLRFAAWIGAPDGPSAIKALLQEGPGGAFIKVGQFMDHLAGKGLSAGYINIHLKAIRSMIKLARQCGMIAWTLEVEAEPEAPVRDSRGPGRAPLESLLRELKAGTSPKAIRDHAILRLLWGQGLRRAELCGLDLADVDLDGQTFSVIRKGKKVRADRKLGPLQIEALRAWIVIRGPQDGPLFGNVDRAGKGAGRLTPRGLYAILEAYGRKVGAAIRPHGIRHTSITEYLRVNGGDIVKGRAFSGHTSNAIFRYVDNTADLQAESAAVMDALL